MLFVCRHCRAAACVYLIIRILANAAAVVVGVIIVFVVWQRRFLLIMTNFLVVCAVRSALRCVQFFSKRCAV